MKLYIAEFARAHDAPHIIGVYSTLELAQKAIRLSVKPYGIASIDWQERDTGYYAECPRKNNLAIIATIEAYELDTLPIEKIYI